MKNKNIGYKKVFILAAILLIVAGVAFFVYQKRHHQAPSHSELIKQVEKQDVNNNKASLPAKDSTNSGSDGAKAGTSSSGSSSSVVITSAAASGDTVTVSSYVSGIIEDGGTCTLALQKDGSTVTRTSGGISDASHTTCPTFTLNNASHSVLASGTWSATVSYSSPRHPTTITSQAQKIEVR